jgi:iron complex transport system permease protein
MQNNSTLSSFSRLFSVAVLVMILLLLSMLYGSAGWSWELDHWSSDIFWKLRLPRGLMAMLAGGALALAGFWMQLLFKNPLASPSVLGVTNGASLGVAFVTMAAPSWLGYNLIEWTLLGSLLGALLVLFLLAVVRIRLNSKTSLLIFGVMLGHLAGALETIFQRAAARNDLPNLIYWSMGSFSKASMEQVGVLFLGILVTVAMVLKHQRAIDVFALGDSIAQSMHIDPKRVANVLIFSSGILTALVTAFCGPIAFIGLAAPHLAKRWWPHRLQKRLLPAVLLTGMVIALACDSVARFLNLPINAITSLVGAPWVMWWLYQNKTARHG